MKQFIMFSLVMIIFTIGNNVNAQEKEKLAYFYIENLSVESYSAWFKSMDSYTQQNTKYACIPAKIIGVKPENVELLKSRLKRTYESIEQVDLTAKEVEQKCASHRSY